MTKPLLSVLGALALALPATWASATPMLDIPSCGDEKKPQEEPKSPKPSAGPLCGGEDKKPEAPKEPKS